MDRLIAVQLALIQEKEGRKQDLQKILRITKSLGNIIEDAESLAVEKDFTGWFVLIKENEKALSGMEFVGFFNPEVSQEDEEPEWEYAIPIKKLSNLQEFIGW